MCGARPGTLSVVLCCRLEAGDHLCCPSAPVNRVRGFERNHPAWGRQLARVSRVGLGDLSISRGWGLSCIPCERQGNWSWVVLRNRWKNERALASASLIRPKWSGIRSPNPECLGSGPEAGRSNGAVEPTRQRGRATTSLWVGRPWNAWA